MDERTQEGNILIVQILVFLNDFALKYLLQLSPHHFNGHFSSWTSIIHTPLRFLLHLVSM